MYVFKYCGTALTECQNGFFYRSRRPSERHAPLGIMGGSLGGRCKPLLTILLCLSIRVSGWPSNGPRWWARLSDRCSPHLSRSSSQVVEFILHGKRCRRIFIIVPKLCRCSTFYLPSIEGKYYGETKGHIKTRIAEHNGLSARTGIPIFNPSHSNIRSHVLDTWHEINPNFF